jgi:hypothetical protein
MFKFELIINYVYNFKKELIIVLITTTIIVVTMEIIPTEDGFLIEVLIQIEVVAVIMMVAVEVEAIKIIPTITIINRMQVSLNLIAAIQIFKSKGRPYSYKIFPSQLPLKI